MYDYHYDYYIKKNLCRVHKDLLLMFSYVASRAPGSRLVLVSIVSGRVMNHMGHYLPAAALSSQPIMENKMRRGRHNVLMRDALRPMGSLCPRAGQSCVSVCVAEGPMSLFSQKK